MASIHPRRVFGGCPAPRFLFLAVGSLITVGLLAPRAFPLLTGSFYDRGLLAFVHLNTLGVIAAAMIAATFQVVPCALGVELDSGRARTWIFPLHLSGLAVFLLGFYQTWHPVLATGGALLAGGLGLYIYLIARALRRSSSPGLTGEYIAAALVGLSVGVALGFLLAGSKGTWFLGDVTMQVLSAHALMMLAGWVLLMVNGVAYHMIPKISGTCREPLERLARIELALIASGAWLGAVSLLFALGRPWVTFGLLMIVAGQASFAGQMVRLYASVIRSSITPQMLFVLLASGTGLGAAGLVAMGLSRGQPLVSGYWVAAGWLAIGGVALGAIQGLAPVIGTELTGLQLVHARDWQRKLAFVGWAAWTGSLVLVVWAVLARDDELIRLAGYAASLSIGCFALNIVAALVKVAWRRPELFPPARTSHSR